MDDEDEEICATVFTGENKNANGFANTNLALLLNDIEEFVKNGYNVLQIHAVSVGLREGK
jgi:hypothetical protein